MSHSYHKHDHYLLLTPGPLTTTDTVKQVMLKDWCTWDADYNDIVQEIRYRLVALATRYHQPDYTSVLMQGSGTASVESALGSLIPRDGKVLILVNGAYGHRIARICEYLDISHTVIDSGETATADPAEVEAHLREDPDITHIAMVHCETTTGVLNDIGAISELAQRFEKCFIVDAMSSFGGTPMDIGELNIDCLISSANKCIQGVPGFGFVILRKEMIEASRGVARSLSLDLFDQWKCMEDNNGKWRFTSPTHVVRAFFQALLELEIECGVESRHKRYQENQRALVSGMRQLGFETLLPDELQSPFITSFLSPDDPDFTFDRFYYSLKEKGFVIYPGKISQADCFRIGNIGDIYPEDITSLINAVRDSMYWLQPATQASKSS